LRTPHKNTRNKPNIIKQEYQELIKKREKYDQVVSEAAALTVANKKLKQEVDSWKQQFLQEQREKTLLVERERTRSTPINQDPKSQATLDEGLRKRRGSQDSTSPRTDENKHDEKTSDNSLSLSNRTSSSRSSSTASKFEPQRSRDTERELIEPLPPIDTPSSSSIRGYLQIVLFALVFFVLGRIFA